MAFITNDGKLVQAAPWSRQTVTFFMGIIHMFLMFFGSLFNPVISMFGPRSEGSERYGPSTRDYRPGSGPPRPPSRRIGRPNTGSPGMYTPGPACGGCCG